MAEDQGEGGAGTGSHSLDPEKMDAHAGSIGSVLGKGVQLLLAPPPIEVS
jgi:hypothetical protein